MGALDDTVSHDMRVIAAIWIAGSAGWAPRAAAVNILA